MSCKDPFAHRKYHSLYFVAGFLGAIIIVVMLS